MRENNDSRCRIFPPFYIGEEGDIKGILLDVKNCEYRKEVKVLEDRSVAICDHGSYYNFSCNFDIPWCPVVIRLKDRKR